MACRSMGAASNDEPEGPEDEDNDELSSNQVVDNKQCVYKSVVDLYNFMRALHLHNFFFIVNQGLEKVFSVSEGCCMILLCECLV
jgi:hypothetical protein